MTHSPTKRQFETDQQQRIKRDIRMHMNVNLRSEQARTTRPNAIADTGVLDSIKCQHSLTSQSSRSPSVSG